MKTVLVLTVVVLMTSLCLAQAGQSQPAQQQPAAPATQSQSAPTQAATPASGQPEVVTPESVKWTPYKTGIDMAVVSGDPDGSGLYTIRLKMADGSQIAPHWHPQDEDVTVLSGTLQVGMGDKFDPAGLKSLPTGTFAMMPKEMHHYAKAGGETVVEIFGQGPFKINYVNPADDPARAKQ